MPSSWYSTGSSIVMMFFSIVFSVGERGVERRRLARAGRAGDEHGAVGLVEGALEALALWRGHAELLELHDDRALVEDPDDDRLAVHAGQRHDAQVDVMAVDRQADATILRDAPLGDVEVAHDLHAADDAEHHPPLDRGGLDEHAVDPEAHAQLVAVGLEMDVRGALLDGLGDDLVDEPDDRRVVGRLAQVDDVGRALVLLVAVQSSETTSSRCVRREMRPRMSSRLVTAGRISLPVSSAMSSTASTLAGSAIATSSVRSSRKSTGTAS